MEGVTVVLIRREQNGDIDAVREVNRSAFGRAGEAELVDSVRGMANVISFVAEVSSEIVGHVLFSPVRIEDGETLVPGVALGPMAVLPEYQRKGIGSQLVRFGLEVCKSEGYELAVGLGHPEYYPRFGFERADAHGIYFESWGPNRAFMIVELVPGALNGVSGSVRYLPQFSGV